MEYRKLGNLDVSAIGLGTLRTFDVTDDDEIAVRRQIVDNCLNSNVNLIDTAAWYGHGEQFVGEITEDFRDQFYIATKVRAEGKEAGEAQITRSFELLKTDYNDLFQVHNMIDWQTHLPTLEQLKPGSTEGRGQAGETDEGGPGEVIFWDGFRINGNGGGRVGTLTWGTGAARDARGEVGGSLAGMFGWPVGESGVSGSVAGELVRPGVEWPAAGRGRD